MYQAIGEVWLPDVWNGYFVHPSSWLAERLERGMALAVDTAELAGPVVTFGSDGGGAEYCVEVDSGAVWELSSEFEMTADGVYLGGHRAPRRIAASVEGFLEALSAATERYLDTGEGEL